MTIPSITKAEIAYRYYQEVLPERGYDREQSRKQFFADEKAKHRPIDWKRVGKILKRMHKEQLKAIGL